MNARYFILITLCCAVCAHYARFAPITHGFKNVMYVYKHVKLTKKLSYRKQIARQLRTQYVEGIYSGSIGQGSLKVTENGTI